jgi:hypothetical protein
MKKRLSIAMAVAVGMGAILGVGSASAATEFGSGCAANAVKDGAIWVSTGHAPDSPLPATAPISGVITEWHVNTNLTVESEGNFTGEYPRIFQQRLLVLKSNGPESFTVVGEAPGGPLTLKGSNTYLSRVPVQAGDYLGLAGDPYAAYCTTENPADTFGASVGGAPVGSNVKVQNSTGAQVPVTARIEPDADGDGYGDETQDQCPQSAAYQTACPVITVSTLSLEGAKAVTVYVSSSLSAPVAVSGTVKLGKGKKKEATLAAAAKTVAPGTLGRFRLVLTKPVRETLTALSNQKSLKLTITASATNVTGSPSTATSILKLRGKRRPAHHHKPPRHKSAHHPAHHKKPTKK